jgi:putative membrane protein
MSWIRTGTALIGFGFTIFQFFERFNQMSGVALPRHPGMPRLFGLALVGMGTLTLLVALYEHRAVLNHLYSEEYREIAGIGEKRGITPAPVIAVLLILIGLIVTGASARRTAT